MGMENKTDREIKIKEKNNKNGCVFQGGVLVIMTITLLAVTLTEEGGGYPDIKLNTTHPLLLVSLDGFRHDYLLRNIPTLETLAREGVHARFLMPSYPTLTFPNHYSIVTVGSSAHILTKLSEELWEFPRVE